MLPIGCIISQNYEKGTLKEQFILEDGTKMEIKIEEGVIFFDNRMGHKKNTIELGKRYCGIKEFFTEEDLNCYHKKFIDFDASEIYYSDRIASFGEPVFLYGHVELEGYSEEISMKALFLPFDLQVLSEKQIENLIDLDGMYGDTDFCSINFCNGNPYSRIQMEQKEFYDTTIKNLKKGKRLVMKNANQ